MMMNASEPDDSVENAQTTTVGPRQITSKQLNFGNKLNSGCGSITKVPYVL